MQRPDSPPAEPAPAPSPGPAGQHLPDDLGPGEARVADWFARLDRATPPADLSQEVLEAFSARQDAPWRLPGRPARLAVLAVVLLLVVGVGGVTSGVGGRRADSARPLAVTDIPPAVVIDDPSVPLYPGLESFGSTADGDAEDADAPDGESGAR